MAGKISKNKKQTKTTDAERATKRKARVGANSFCNLCDHSDPFDGAFSSYKLLSKILKLI